MRDMARLLAFLLGVFLGAPVVFFGSHVIGVELCGQGVNNCGWAVLAGIFLLSGVLIWRREGAGKIR